MRISFYTTTTVVLGAALALGTIPARTAQADCKNLPSHSDLEAALIAANNNVVLTLNNQMWGTIVAEDGTVCAVAHTGDDNLQSQWLASRVISAQKANTANSLSLGNNDVGANAGLALSTANLWAAVQPGGSLFGLQHSNPVDTSVAYKGPTKNFGSSNDPMVGELIGGVNVFGGGLALYDAGGDSRWRDRRQWRHLLSGPHGGLGDPSQSRTRFRNGRGKRRSREAGQHHLRRSKPLRTSELLGGGRRRRRCSRPYSRPLG